jgi:hypothetical protein
MADEIDRAQEAADKFTEQSLQRVKDKAAQMPVGRPGDCDICGEWSGRLVNGVCAPCRDRHNLP